MSARFSPAREIGFSLALYGAYLAVRRGVLNPEGRARALRNAERLVEFERSLGIDLEPTVQKLVIGVPRTVHVLNVGYAVANIGLSLGWLRLLFKRRHPAYHRERRAAVVAFAGALPVFALLPTSPPRALEGFVDLLREHGIDIEHPLLIKLYNPIAAMPSHHMAFAVVTGGGLVALAPGRLGRIAGRSYPPLVALVVIGTGNHYVLDVVAGAALGVVARKVTR